MLRPAQPSRRATFVLTESAPSTFGTFDANVAVEPANTPGMVRVYRRAHPSLPWQPHGQILDSQAASLYGYSMRPDSSD